jgi:hypothetical protein
MKTAFPNNTRLSCPAILTISSKLGKLSYSYFEKKNNLERHPPVQWVTGDIFPGVKWPEGKADQLPP